MNVGRIMGNTKTKLAVVAAIAILLLLAWAPWLTDENVKEMVRSNKMFMLQHGPGTGQENPEMHVGWVPFGRWVTTYEGGWFVTFYGAIV